MAKPTTAELFAKYEKMRAESDKLAGHTTGFGVLSPAPLRKRQEHAAEMKAVREALLASFTKEKAPAAEPDDAALVLQEAREALETFGGENTLMQIFEPDEEWVKFRFIAKDYRRAGRALKRIDDYLADTTAPAEQAFCNKCGWSGPADEAHSHKRHDGSVCPYMASIRRQPKTGGELSRELLAAALHYIWLQERQPSARTLYDTIRIHLYGGLHGEKTDVE